MDPIRLELPTGLGVGPVNAYLFTQPEVVLVDTGIKSSACWDALVAGLAEHGLTPADIARVIITHAHVDHYGLAARLTRESAAAVWTSDICVPWLRITPDVWAEHLALYRDSFLMHLGLPSEAVEMILFGMQMFDRQAEPVPAERLVGFALDDTLMLGGEPWRVLHTPGHASMMTCFYQPESRRLLSADMLLATTPTPVVEQNAPGIRGREPALPRFMQSLDLLQSLPIDIAYPGHGRPIENAHPLIRRQRERIISRKAECLAFIQQGLHTVPELLNAMYAHQPVSHRLMGLWMLIGYLDLLAAEGAIVNDDPEGLWRFVAV